MTEATLPEPRRLTLFPYLYKHHARTLFHHSQVAERLRIPREPFRRIVEAGLGPWPKPAPTPGDNGETDSWFTGEMLDLWRAWLAGSAPPKDLITAKQIVMDWDRTQPARDHSFLDDHGPHEYFRYFLDREYLR
ncbi:hypothetical protein [Devosia sp.]|uniref:hypothetical protein n=1 Tax=Devosia sp. TaxID=1871048 RepID=UPI001AD03935|nr:hypothetical protein [Devosia sp.]MBN9310713.1 hypothetical protein [Devosia sp.]